MKRSKDDMRFSEMLQSEHPVLSLEFFPPKKNAALAEAFRHIAELAEYGPDFMTVTYGAGGGTRSRTKQMVDYIHNQLNVPAVAHLTCVGHSASEIDSIVKGLAEVGLTNILALRGDPPKGQSSFEQHPEGFSCARDLTRYISAHSAMSVAVAGYPESHPEAKSSTADIEYLREKVDAGAELIITQLFFDTALYVSFVDRCRAAGIAVPILPGVMPIGSASQVRRFTQMCGASIPDALSCKLDQLSDQPDALLQFGVEYACEMCEELLEQGAPGIHLYTLNRCTQVRPVIERVGLGNVAGKRMVASEAGQRPPAETA